jgi:hypothetical protein
VCAEPLDRQMLIPDPVDDSAKNTGSAADSLLKVATRDDDVISETTLSRQSITDESDRAMDSPENREPTLDELLQQSIQDPEMIRRVRSRIADSQRELERGIDRLKIENTLLKQKHEVCICIQSQLINRLQIMGGFAQQHQPQPPHSGLPAILADLHQRQQQQRQLPQGLHPATSSQRLPYHLSPTIGVRPQTNGADIEPATLRVGLVEPSNPSGGRHCRNDSTRF